MRRPFLLLISLILLNAVDANAQYRNVFIDSLADETSICINPKNPAQIVAGANILNSYESDDTGNTWHRTVLNSTYGVWGDPVVDVDTQGTFYYFHLANPDYPHFIDRIVCQKGHFTTGINYQNGTYTGLDSPKKQDKPWVVVNRKTNEIYVTWTQFDAYGTANLLDSSVILFSKSSDTGHTWTPPVRISAIAGDCLDSDNTVEGATPVISPDGTLYVIWAGHDGIYLNKSTDDGLTWMAHEQLLAAQPTGWDYDIPGVYRCDGLPFAVCDVSSGPNRGTIYVNWSDQRNGVNNTDVWLIKSIDGGQTWSNVKRVNDDTGAHQQFMSSLTVDQKTGYVYCLFYDRRAYTDNRTDVYLAVSKDGGATFFNQMVSTTAFLPWSTKFMGDYMQVAAYNNIVRPCWTRMDNGTLTIWTAIVDGETLSVPAFQIPALPAAQVYPNPVKDIATVSFGTTMSGKVSIYVTDVLGRKVATIKQNEQMDEGAHQASFNQHALNLRPGIYFCTIVAENGRVAQRFEVAN